MPLSGPLLSIRLFYFFFFFLNILKCFVIPQVTEPLGCPGTPLCNSAALTLWSSCCLAAVRAITSACRSCCCRTSLLLLCCCSCHRAPAHPEVFLCVFCQLSHAKWLPPGWASLSPFVFWFIAHHHLLNFQGNLYALNPVSTFFKKHKLNQCSFTNHN